MIYLKKHRNQKQPPEVFCKKKGVLRNFAKFTGKHLCQSLFFIKVAERLFTEHVWATTSKDYPKVTI